MTVVDTETFRPIIASIMDAHDLIRRHAEERMEILSELFASLEVYMDKKDDESNLISNTLAELNSLHDHITTYSMQKAANSGDEGYLKQLKLQSINKIMSELDQLEATRNALLEHFDESIKGLEGRIELTGILEEYVELGHAANYKIAAEIADLEDLKYKYAKNIEMYSLLSRYDPRIQALTILEKHPQGISTYQLIRMLDISTFEARRIINDLVGLGMVYRKEGSDLLHIPLTPVSLNIIRNAQR